MPNPVCWFEIPTLDINRAKKFYESVFGYTLTPQESGQTRMALFPMEENSVNASGSLVYDKDHRPSTDGTLIYFGVESIEKTLDKIKSATGKILKEKTSIGEYGFMAIFQDTERNRIGLYSMN